MVWALVVVSAGEKGLGAGTAVSMSSCEAHVAPSRRLDRCSLPNPPGIGGVRAVVVGSRGTPLVRIRVLLAGDPVGVGDIAEQGERLP